MKPKKFKRGDLVFIETENSNSLMVVINSKPVMFLFMVNEKDAEIFALDELIDDSINLTLIEKGAFK